VTYENILHQQTAIFDKYVQFDNYQSFKYDKNYRNLVASSALLI